MRRLSEIVGARVEKAIELLPLPIDTKLKITWELAPALLPRNGQPMFSYLLTLCVPVPLTEDFVAPVRPLEDANASQETINEAVRELYAEALQGWADQLQEPSQATEERTPGGLIKG
jgi:hypothetical protein